MDLAQVISLALLGRASIKPIIARLIYIAKRLQWSVIEARGFGGAV